MNLSQKNTLLTAHIVAFLFPFCALADSQISTYKPVMPVVSPASPTPGFPNHYTLESLIGMQGGTAEPGSFEAAIFSGTPWLEERYRYENGTQSGIHRHAQASTLRSRLGYETGSLEHFKIGFEVQNVKDIGPEHFNNGINGNTLYPTVTDPEETAMRQAYLGYDGLYKTEFKVGRQLINLDNQRFVGQSDWRQLGNNFDAISINNTYFDKADLFYAYVRKTHRGYGDDVPLGTLTGNTHLINASYQVAQELKVAGYSYLINVDSSIPSIAMLSTSTYGIRLTGKNIPNDILTLSYSLEAANQRNYTDNPFHANNTYYLVEPVAGAYGITGKLGYEMMQGDGTTAFQTPLNSNHSFDGWGDKFTTMPVNGLVNRYATLIYKLPFGCEWIKGTELTATYRKFDSDAHHLDYGHEWDGLISKTLSEHYSANLEMADYRASNHAYTNTYKIFAFVGIKY